MRILCLVMTTLAVVMLSIACSTTTPFPTKRASLPTSEETEQLKQPSLEMPTAVPLPKLGTELAATPEPETGDMEDVLVRVNGQPITRGAYQAELRRSREALARTLGIELRSERGQQALIELEERVLDRMIDQMLIEQAAERQGITVSPDQVQREITQMREQGQERFDAWLQANGLTLDELQDQIRRDLVTAALRDKVTETLPRETEQVRAAHILISEGNTAKAALGELEAGRDFCAVVTRYSEDELTRDNCGDLGFFPRGVMPKPLEEVAFALQPGETSDLVLTQLGYHIVRVLAREASRPIDERLWPMIQQQAFAQWLETERKRAQIEYLD